MMNGVFEMIFSAENIRTAVILIAVFLLKADIGKKFAETRLDFTKEINAVRNELKEEIAALREKINAVREELKSDIAALREELTEKINAVREELKGDIAQVREEVREIKTNDIAHLNQGFRALTFVLTQKAVITPEEREHIDKSLE
jgi:archaellum component FlaC